VLFLANRGKKPNDGFRASIEAAPKRLERAFPGVQLSPISTTQAAWERASQAVLFLGEDEKKER